MPKQLKSARTGVIVLLALGAIAMALSVYVRERASAAEYLPDAIDLATALHRAGLDPEALTAAGVSPGAASTLVQNALTHFLEAYDQLNAADAAHSDAKRSHDRLARLVRSGRASQEEINALPTARSTLASATAQRASVIQDLFGAATDDLTETQRATLTQLHANRDWTADLEFKVLARTQEQWIALRDALTNERIADKRGEQPDQAAQDLLDQLRSVPAVSAARASLDTNLAAVTAAWNEAAGL